jgi:tetratricopeptide (TPR) repeat protein
MIVAPKKLLLVLGLLITAPLHADFPKPITLPKTEVPAKIGSTIPATITSSISQTRQLALPGLVEQINNGALSPQQAWDDKLIDVNDLLWIFTSCIEPWGSFGGKKNVEVRRALVRLLIQHGGDKSAAPEKLPPVVRLWLADYYQSVKDEKSVALCESILSEIKMPVKGENALVFQTVERIGWYYRNVGQYEKSAQSWLRMKDYHADVGWWIPDSMVAAARQYYLGGNEAKAQELYAQVPAFGNGWLSGLAFYDQANALITKGQHTEARALLTKTVQGNRAEDVQVALWALLAYSHYVTGDFTVAQQWSKKALKQYKSLKNPSTDSDLEFQVKEAHRILQWSAQWMKQPFICEPKVISSDEPRSTKPLTYQIMVRSHHFLPLRLKSSDARLKAQVSDFNKPRVPRRYFFEQEVTLEIAPELIEKTLEATLAISSPQFPDFQIDVPVTVTVQ